MIKRPREGRRYIISLMMLVFGLGGLWANDEPVRGLVLGSIQGLVIGLFNVLVIWPAMRRSRESHEEIRAEVEKAQQSAARERDARTEEAAQSYERQHGRRPW